MKSIEKSMDIILDTTGADHNIETYLENNHSDSIKVIENLDGSIDITKDQLGEKIEEGVRDNETSIFGKYLTVVFSFLVWIRVEKSQKWPKKSIGISLHDMYSSKFMISLQKFL